MLTESLLLQKQAVHLRLLNEISIHLQRLMKSKNFYQEVADKLHSHFPTHTLSIWSVDAGKTCTLQAQNGPLPLPREAPELRLTRNRSLVSIPICKGTQVISVLKIECPSDHEIEPQDSVFFEMIASQIGAALLNHELLNEKLLEHQKLLHREKTLKGINPAELKGTQIIGSSPAILTVLAMVDKIAPTTATVLIQGESGTGKELIAKRLHSKSERGHEPYVTVNCGALQESLLESELFGHEKGSFTGAVAQKMGLCEMADRGTLFLDEIGEMSLQIQAKLLRFLQEGEFYRIGGKRPICVDVRVISATNRDLENEVKEGRFREDLFYRLNTITLRMPPLRKRKEDIPALVDFFLKTSRFGGSSYQIKRIDPKVMEVLSNYEWPGNIRELQNTIERLKILSENNEIRLEDIPFSIRMPKLRTEAQEFTLDMPLEIVEKSHILRTLAYNHGNKTKTAQSLGITIKTLYNKLHRYGILQTTHPTLSAEHSDLM